VRPDELHATEVGYYADPLRRLAALQTTVQELATGFVYVSPGLGRTPFSVADRPTHRSRRQRARRAVVARLVRGHAAVPDR
jgi:hypothetical protein